MGGCDSKTDSVVTPIKASSTIPLNEIDNTQRRKSEHFVEESDRGKTITTLTFPHSDLNEEDEDEINLRVNILKKKSISQRKSLQQDFIRSNLTKTAVMYLIQNDWSEQYTQFLKNPSKLTMREINNKILLDGKQLKSGLREKTDYYPVTQKVWLFLKKMYGGGPEVKKAAGLPTYDIPMTGLKNNHWMCYLNTGMQCLLSIGEFAHYFSSKAFNKIKHDTKVSKKVFSIATLKEIRSLQDSRIQQKALSELTELLQSKFDKRQQHDCHQFLRYYMQMLQDQLNPIDNRVKSSKPPVKNPTSEQYFTNYLNTHTSIVDLLFAGQLTNMTKCSGCDNVSIIHEPFFELVVETRGSLQSALGKFFSVEKLADLYECEKCSSKKKAMRQFFISKNPLYLLIFIKRFTGNKKITDVMDYPLKLNVEKFTKYSAGQTQYNLHSLVVHRGSMEKGHYYCLTKRSQKWYYVNDEIVKQITAKDSLGLEAYLLIYQRQK